MEHLGLLFYMTPSLSVVGSGYKLCPSNPCMQAVGRRKIACKSQNILD